MIASNEEREEEFRYWLKRYNIQTINIAGSRESTSPGIQEFTRAFLRSALEELSRITQPAASFLKTTDGPPE
jgi:hypothetical protein